MTTYYKKNQQIRRVLTREEKYNKWRIGAGFGMPNKDVMSEYARSRKPLPEDIKAERHKHMSKLHKAGAPYSWIGRLYNISRHRAMTIIKGD